MFTTNDAIQIRLVDVGYYITAMIQLQAFSIIYLNVICVTHRETTQNNSILLNICHSSPVPPTATDEKQSKCRGWKGHKFLTE
jgi:hypothetical protein